MTITTSTLPLFLSIGVGVGRMVKQNICMLTHPYQQELCPMEILQNDVSSSNHTWEVPYQSPLYTIRTRKRHAPRRQHSRWVSLPLHLSFSSLSEDSLIKKLISIETTTTTNTIQHCRKASRIHMHIDLPQSLPAAATALGNPITIPANTSPAQSYQDWHLINKSSQPSTPSFEEISEPETWILLSDDS